MLDLPAAQPSAAEFHPYHPADDLPRVPSRGSRVAPREMGVTLACLLPEGTRSTICSASTCTLILARWDARRSRSNASSGPHPCWAMMTPLARSITAMVCCRAASRANAEWCRISCRDRPRRIWSQVARARALASRDISRRARASRRTACKRSASDHAGLRGSEPTIMMLAAARGGRKGHRASGRFPAAGVRHDLTGLSGGGSRPPRCGSAAIGFSVRHRAAAGHPTGPGHPSSPSLRMVLAHPDSGGSLRAWQRQHRSARDQPQTAKPSTPIRSRSGTPFASSNVRASVPQAV
jgi:hypothetical protein